MLIGFNTIKSNLLNSYHNQKLHHAILLEGKKGIGKSSFAKEFVAEIFKSENVSFLQHPDLFLIEKDPEKKEIGVDKIRAIADFSNQTSAISANKFIIIDSACELNKSSSNALLKILEEPKSNNFLILITHNSNKVLTTIKSRCQNIKINDLSFADFSQILQKNNPQISSEEINILSEICDNSPAKAINNGVALISIYDLFLTSIKNNKIDEKLIKKIADKNFSFEIFAEIFEFFINRLIKFSNSIELNFYFCEKEIFLLLTNKFSIAQIFDISDEIKESINKTKSLNLDKKLTFINIFNRF